MRRVIPFILAISTLLLGGCDMLGIETPDKASLRREADSKAVGGGCRYSGRAIEDCYSMNKKADKAAVFAGWREMNDYMRENKIESVAPAVASAPIATAKADVDGEAEGDAPVASNTGGKPGAAAAGTGSKPAAATKAKPHAS
jgi:hypothetical protein